VSLTASLLSPDSLIRSLGGLALVGVIGIIFAECGLLVGFFLPGDSLLFVTGLLIAQGFIHASLWLTCVLLSVAAVAGNIVGYWIGRKAGPAIFNRPDSRFFKQEYVDRAHEFFSRHGVRAILLARFVPIVRTFITVTAGVARMTPRVYNAYSLIGGVIWASGLTILGHQLGHVAMIKNNIEIFSIGIVVISFIPVAFELLRGRRASRG
jgi:membrane-associated protein